MPVAAVSQKATPDLGKLIGMTSRTVQVSKHTSKQGAGQIVLPPLKQVTVEDITNLLKLIPQNYGPGTYTFEVYDEGGTEKDVWVTKLGGDTQEVSQMASPFSFGMSPPSAAPQQFTGPAPEGSIALGNGYFYNQELGLLSAPGRPPVPWRPGEPVPTLVSSAASAQPAATQLPPWMTPPGGSPWGTPPWAQPSWGAMPAVDSSSNQQIEVLKAQIADGETRRREEQHRNEINELRTGFTRAIEEISRKNDSRFEQLFAKLGEKPTGPSPEVEALKAELVAMRTSTDSQAREDRLRAEFATQRQQFEQLIRELTANKADPMMGFLGSIMQSFQSSQATTVQAMRDSTAATTEKLSGSVMGPLQMMQFMQMMRDNPADKAQQELFSTIFTMMQGLIRTQAELNTDSTPPWVGIAQAGMESIGTIAQALSQRGQPQAPQAPQYMPPPQQMQPQRRAPQQQTVAAAPPQAPLPAQAAADPRAAAATRVFGTGTPADNAREAAAASTGLYAGAAKAPTTSAGGVPPASNGIPTTPEGIAAHVAVPPSHNPPVVAEVIPPRKRGRKPAAAPVPVVAVAPARISVEEQEKAFAGATPEALRAIVAESSDDEFFGAMLMPYVQDLRAQVAAGLPVEQAVSLLAQAPASLQAFGAFPPVLELYNAGQFEIMLERVLPDATPEYRQDAANLLAQHETGDDDDDDEGDEEGDDEGEESAQGAA